MNTLYRISVCYAFFYCLPFQETGRNSNRHIFTSLWTPEKTGPKPRSGFVQTTFNLTTSFKLKTSIHGTTLNKRSSSTPHKSSPLLPSSSRPHAPSARHSLCPTFGWTPPFCCLHRPCRRPPDDIPDAPASTKTIPPTTQSFSYFPFGCDPP